VQADDLYWQPPNLYDSPHVVTYVRPLLIAPLSQDAVKAEHPILPTITHADNLVMREAFKESGFDAHETCENGDMEVALSLVLPEATVARSEVRESELTIRRDVLYFTW